MSHKLNKVVIFGCSSYTKSIISLCKKIGGIELLAICVDDDYLNLFPKHFNGIEIIGFNEALYKYSDAFYVIAIGYKKMRNRKRIYLKLIENNLELITLISPNAYVSTKSIGRGCIIFDGVVIENDSVIHDNVTIWSNVTICHDVNIDEHCFIAAGTTIGGFTKVGELSFVGFNSTLIDEVKVGNECLIGACSLINANIDDFSKCYGIPAKLVNKIDIKTGVCVS